MQKQKIGDTSRYEIEQEYSFGHTFEEKECLVTRTGENTFSVILKKTVRCPLAEAFEIVIDK